MKKWEDLVISFLRAKNLFQLSGIFALPKGRLFADQHRVHLTLSFTWSWQAFQFTAHALVERGKQQKEDMLQK